MLDESSDSCCDVENVILGEGRLGRQAKSGDGGCDGEQQQHSPLVGQQCCRRDDRPVVGENILHDICRYRPPLDVLETLLAAVRDRYRGESFTSATDHFGRTPLHIAAAFGADAVIIDALVRVDPTPASMPDVHLRSPLHLAVNYCGVRDNNIMVEPALHYKQQEQQLRRYRPNRDGYCCTGWKLMRPQIERMPSHERTPNETFQVVQILKEAMLTHPGKIDFNDEDGVGYSPLDYAMECGKPEGALIRTLIHRNAPTCCILRRSDTNGGDSILEDPTNNDVEFLQKLERDDIEALTNRIHKLNPSRQKKWMEYELFKLFVENKDQLLTTRSTVVGLKAADVVVATGNAEISVVVCNHESSSCPQRKNKSSTSKVMTPEDMYNKHLEDYFDGYMCDLDVGDIEHYVDGGGDDGFDIFVDPEEGNDNDQMLMKVAQIKGMHLPLREISIIHDDDDCVSVLSTVKLRGTTY